MIKSKHVSIGNNNIVLTFPKLMKSSLGDIVLMTLINNNLGEGTLVKSGHNYDDIAYHQHHSSWAMDDFTDLPIGEQIVLSNEGEK